MKTEIIALLWKGLAGIPLLLQNWSLRSPASQVLRKKSVWDDSVVFSSRRSKAGKLFDSDFLSKLCLLNVLDHLDDRFGARCRHCPRHALVAKYDRCIAHMCREAFDFCCLNILKSWETWQTNSFSSDSGVPLAQIGPWMGQSQDVSPKDFQSGADPSSTSLSQGETKLKVIRRF